MPRPFRSVLSVALPCVVAVLAAAVPRAAASSAWPGFRGPESDGSVEGSLLGDGGSGLAVGWKRALGSGYSSVVVGEGKVVAMFADGDADVVAAFDSDSGKELWRYRIGDIYKGHDGSHDGPISTPLIAGGRVFGLGAWGDLFAVDVADGRQVWAKQIADEYGAVKPYYGFTSSPILVDGVLVLQIGATEGKAIAGFDPADGKLLWTAGDDGVEYQSPIAATLGGRTMVLAATNAKLFGIDPAGGEVLWSYEHGGDDRAMGGRTIVPLPAGDDRFLIMNKVDASTMLKISAGTEVAYEVSELWSNNTIRGSYVQPVYHDGHVYAISGRILTCVDAATGETRWRSREPGDGFLTLVGGQLVVATKAGGLYVVRATPDGYEQLAGIDLFEENAWSEVAFADGHLFARSMSELARVDVASAVADRGGAGAWLADTEFGAFLGAVHAADDKQAVVDAFFAETRSFPIVEGPDLAHFVFRGEADDVGIVGDMLGARREDPMHRVDGTDLFYYSMRLEPDAAVTYGFLKDFGDEAEADPLNPEGADGVFGEVSWLSMPAWRKPGHVEGAAATRRGRLEELPWEPRFEEEVRGEDGEPTGEKETKTVKRTVQVYLPAGFDPSGDRRYPTVYVIGGQSALEDGLMKNSLDNLIGDSVEPLIAVFIMREEGAERENVRPFPRFLSMLAESLVPMIDERFPTATDPGHRGLLGMGGAGAPAILGGLSHPDVFGRVGMQSAVLFGVSVAELLGGVGAAERPLTIYQSWGTYDLRSPHEAWDMAEDNRRAFAALREAGYRPAGGELPMGHGWRCWRAQTDEMLEALFPLPRTIALKD
jgi:enterochelin esterase-like enzyme/outer membrane protein assembly factor BamB